MTEEGMVHALEEAHRVLQADGLLVDVRPGPTHRRVGLLIDHEWEPVATMKESLDDDRAANAAVKAAIHLGLFRSEDFIRCELTRHIGTLRNLRSWLEDFAGLVEFPNHEWLLESVGNALAKTSTRADIAVRGPLEIRALRKLN